MTKVADSVVECVVLRGCVQHEGKRYLKSSVILLGSRDASRLARLGVVQPLSSLKGTDVTTNQESEQITGDATAETATETVKTGKTTKTTGKKTGESDVGAG